MYIFKYISGGHAQPDAPVHLLYLILKAVYLKGKVQNIFLPLHSIYRVSEFCRYGSGCQYSNYYETRPKHALTLHLVLFPVHVSIRSDQRALQAHILTRVKEGIACCNASRKYIPVAVCLHGPFHGQDSTEYLILPQTV